MEPKFKIGDVVDILNVFTEEVSYVGYGYKENLKGLEIITIQKTNIGNVYYFCNHLHGILEHALIDSIGNREDKFKNLLDGIKI